MTERAEFVRTVYIQVEFNTNLLRHVYARLNLFKCAHSFYFRSRVKKHKEKQMKYLFSGQLRNCGIETNYVLRSLVALLHTRNNRLCD